MGESRELWLLKVCVRGGNHVVGGTVSKSVDGWVVALWWLSVGMRAS